MHNEFTSVIEQDGEWFIGYCPEIPGANGQGRTVKEFRANLSEAIALILEDRREDGLRGVPQDAIRETVIVLGQKAFLHVFYVEKGRHDGFILSARVEEKIDKARSYGAKRTTNDSHSQQRRTAQGCASASQPPARSVVA